MRTVRTVKTVKTVKTTQRRDQAVPEPPAACEPQHSAGAARGRPWLGYVVAVFKNITVQGVVHFTYSRRHVAEHFMWLATLLLCLFCTVSLCNETWRRFKDNPTVISLERDAMSWNVSYPAVYICPASKHGDEALDKLVANLSAQTRVATDTLRSYLKALANLTYDNMHAMKEFENIPGLPQKGLLAIVEQIQYKFEHGDIFENKNKFHKRLFQIMTENGICYAHNSLLTPIVALGKVDENMTFSPLTYTASKRMTAIQVPKIKTDYEVFVESSTEVPDWLSVGRRYKYGFVVSLAIIVRTMYSTTSVRELDVHHRRCRFFDESELAVSPKYYSYNLCMMECRKSALQDWCRCSPYFYGRLGNITECGVKGMLCIAKHIDQLKAIADTTCKCYQTCDVDSYGILEEISTEVSDEFDFFGGTRFEWTLPTFPNIRLKKDVLFSSTNLLEAFGGTVNLFLGASILSGIEIIYYCTIHLFFYIFKKNNSIHF